MRLGCIAGEPPPIEALRVVFVRAEEMPVAVPDFHPGVVASPVRPHGGAHGAGRNADRAAGVHQDDREPGAGGPAGLHRFTRALIRGFTRWGSGSFREAPRRDESRGGRDRPPGGPANGVQMSDHEMILQSLMGGFIPVSFAGPLRRTVPAKPLRGDSFTPRFAGEMNLPNGQPVRASPFLEGLLAQARGSRFVSSRRC